MGHKCSVCRIRKDESDDGEFENLDTPKHPIGDAYLNIGATTEWTNWRKPTDNEVEVAFKLQAEAEKRAKISDIRKFQVASIQTRQEQGLLRLSYQVATQKGKLLMKVHEVTKGGIQIQNHRWKLTQAMHIT
ncbi:hypothetical protein AAMO2058_000594600 [Amorphochlora amoebiformis]|mmetsp:Transcript_35384/g.57075  ORF Transcript_35384/g.57075 Transcript_35384/m.57075 type:complete len:132 (-) Transcript_35384:94-489(-)